LLPNLIIAGVAGASGGPTSLITFGKEVMIYAPGEGITVRASGGIVMRSSETSFARPKVARTAAAMLFDPEPQPRGGHSRYQGRSFSRSDGMPLLHPAAASKGGEMSR
jgi:hypothetical protein